MHVDVKRICVATDFSDTADHGLRYAATLADLTGAEVHLLHVLENLHELVTHPDFSHNSDAVVNFLMRLEERDVERDEIEDPDEVKQFLRGLENGIEDKIGAFAQDDLWQRLNIVRAVRRGHAVKEICRYAETTNIDLLVVGSHGRQGLQHLLMGSVAERVARSAPCPVLIVRKHQRDFVVHD